VGGMVRLLPWGRRDPRHTWNASPRPGRGSRRRHVPFHHRSSRSAADRRRSPDYNPL